jgi:hypothetical protein
MIFTGKSLELLHYALDLAMDEVQNQIATCPDVIQYEDDIDELEMLKGKLQRMRDRIAVKLTAPTKEKV